jgi:hypothetical protein
VEKGFFFDNGQIHIINKDIFTTKKIAAGSIDLLVTSPHTTWTFSTLPMMITLPTMSTGIFPGAG